MFFFAVIFKWIIFKNFQIVYLHVGAFTIILPSDKWHSSWTSLKTIFNLVCSDTESSDLTATFLQLSPVNIINKVCKM